MEPELKRYVQSFLLKLSETLACPDLIQEASLALGSGKRYQFMETLNISSWPSEDVTKLSAAYFEAIAYAGEQLINQENGAELSLQYQDYVKNKIVPVLVAKIPDDKRFEVIQTRIKNEMDRIDALDYSWGFWAAAATVGAVAAAAVGFGAALNK